MSVICRFTIFDTPTIILFYIRFTIYATATSFSWSVTNSTEAIIFVDLWRFLKIHEHEKILGRQVQKSRTTVNSNIDSVIHY